MAQVQITLSTGLRKRVNQFVKSGDYESVAEFVREGTRRLVLEMMPLLGTTAQPAAHHADVIDVREQQKVSPKPAPAPTPPKPPELSAVKQREKDHEDGVKCFFYVKMNLCNLCTERFGAREPA